MGWRYKFNPITCRVDLVQGDVPDVELYAITDPAVDAAVNQTVVDGYAGVIITLTAAGNSQTIATPSSPTTIREFTVINNDTSTHSITVDGQTLGPSESQKWLWDGSAWLTVGGGAIDRVVTVAKSGAEFTTIQAAIDYAYATWGPASPGNGVGIYVAPGVYEEQIHSYRNYVIIGKSGSYSALVGRTPVTLYNTGADADHYPLRTENDRFHMVGMTIVTDVGGVFGVLPAGHFSSCYFRTGYFIERDDTCFVEFAHCSFNGSNGCFLLEGAGLAGTRNISIRGTTEIQGGVPTVTSTHTGVANFKWESVNCRNVVSIGGDWEWRTNRVVCYNVVARCILDTTEGIYLTNTNILTGLHFVSDPLEFIMINSSFKGVSDNKIPDGEGDITADVPITNVEFSSNTMHNGLDGEIQVSSTTKRVGGTDSYRTINEALLACSPGDTVRVGVGEYNEQITLPAGVDLNGSERGGSIIYSDTGTVLTKTAGVSNIDKITLRSTPVSGTTDAKLIDISGGELYFNGSILEMSPTETYADMVVNSGGTLEFNLSNITYNNITSGGGTHNLFNLSGLSDISILNSVLTANIADANDDLNVINDTGTSIVTCHIRSTYGHVYATNGSYDGVVTFYKGEYPAAKELLVDTSHLDMESSGNGTGQIFKIDSNAGGFEVHANANHFEVTGFTNNYFADIATGDTLVSHFDDLTAIDGVIGDGIYSYVNSPADGDIQISGSYLNMYANALTVGARGADHTVIQDAIDAITDAASDNRYAVLIYPGTYTENVDLTGKPHIDLMAVTTRESTLITSASGTTLTFGNEKTSIEKLTVESTGGKIVEVPAGGAGKEYRFRECTLKAIINNTYTDAVEINNGIVQFTDSILTYTQTGTGGGTHRLINIIGAQAVTFFASDMAMTVVSTADDVIGIEEANIVVPVIKATSRITINRTGVVTGETIGYYANGTSSDKLITGGLIILINNGSGGNASAIKTAGAGCVVTSQSNIIKVLNFTNNWAANVGATDIVYSNFDTITAAQHSTGAGIYNVVHAMAAGDFHVKRDVIVERNVEVGGVLALATGTTVNELSTDDTLASDSDDIVSTQKAHKGYVDTNLLDYIKKNGSVGFTGVVAGITPIINAHLATKAYVDGVGAGGGANDLGPFVDKDAVTPPGGESVGERWIVAGLGGAWSGFAIDDVAIVDSIDPTVWSNVTPVAGKHGWVTDEGIDYTFNGADWVATGTLIDHTTIQNVGVKTHSEIDTHVNNVTTNPHVVTKANVSLENLTNDAQLKRAANDFNGFGAKAAPADVDRFLMEDSGDGLAKKYVLANNMYDKRVKISSNDTVQDYLINKLIGTVNKITLTEIGDGGNEDLQIGIGSDLTDAITHVTSDGKNHSDVVLNNAARHAELHSIASHNDTTATGAELETLTDGSNADALHGHVHGSEFQETSDDAVSETTEVTFQQKLRMTTSDLPSGNYRIGFYCETYQNNVNGSVVIQVELNDTTVISEQQREPADVDDRFSHGGFNYQSLSGVNTIDIDFMAETTGTAYIRRARIELWRIS